jgi:hypothetical protein
MNHLQIEPVKPKNEHFAVDLLTQFFREEGFTTPRDRIARHLGMMMADDSCWAAVASHDGAPAGVVSVTTMLHVEWGRLGEIGDL